eukprot:gene47735-64019_t
MDSFMDNEPMEGAVVKGTVVAIEKDLAIIDVGLKTEGRVSLKEFGVGEGESKDPPKVGDSVEVFLERVKQSKYPWAAINVEGPDGKPVDGVGHDVVMKEFGSVKVALVPVQLDETPELATTKDWKFDPTVATALDAAQKARDAG